jgi:hypothetical protein
LAGYRQGDGALELLVANSLLQKSRGRALDRRLELLLFLYSIPERALDLQSVNSIPREPVLVRHLEYVQRRYSIPRALDFHLSMVLSQY